ncbi:YitT family protein [Clostridium fallax]|uniref:Uncharacterized membrane-anchored protein YitT, contains DUF161 and DUF2179 domains n=1 Tax=Clostridium fallax TaxID=1533 RepID=A0A1M4VKJ3_9CLOT|nr:YitT family protein [Clostridium fallax]SHE69428.1 Uncharacterized membrane-anchored protein YitT, contains DUF161 and DUF2179 domains [Clostridium fallax]SQB22766.1 transporter protein [Clostridium fallax]
MNFKLINRLIATLFYGFLAGVGINCFLTPANIYSGGVTGLAQLLSSLGTDLLHINISISMWVLLVNLPLIYISWCKLGKKFTVYTLIAVVLSSFFIKIIPVATITNNQLLAAIFGGVLTGAGVGFCFRAGFSTGGTDIIVLVVQKLTGKSVGQLGMILNGIIVSIAGIMYGWEKALYSLVAIYTMTKIIDIFYVQQYKLTVTIFTTKEKEVVQNLLENNMRGVTVGHDFFGAYKNEKLSSVVTVISKHELLFIKKNILDIDPKAFVNVQPTVEVIGKFVDNSLI